MLFRALVLAVQHTRERPALPVVVERRVRRTLARGVGATNYPSVSFPRVLPARFVEWHRLPASKRTVHCAPGERGTVTRGGQYPSGSRAHLRRSTCVLFRSSGGAFRARDFPQRADDEPAA